MNLGLISCTKKKRKNRCGAREMYSPSALFSKAYTYASRIYDQVAILSAKYGLLLPDDVIDPYDLTLNKMPIDERQQWSEKVLEQMKKKLYLDEIDEVFFHAGKRYRELLIPTLEGMGKKCLVPLEGLSYGQQLKWYNRQN